MIQKRDAVEENQVFDAYRVLTKTSYETGNAEVIVPLFERC
jgi:hypothetical protein